MPNSQTAALQLIVVCSNLLYVMTKGKQDVLDGAAVSVLKEALLGSPGKEKGCLSLSRLL